MSHQVLNEAMTRVLQLTSEALKESFPQTGAVLTSFQACAKVSATEEAVYLVPYLVTPNEQGTRTEATRERTVTGAGGDELYRFYRAPLPLTLRFLFLIRASGIEQELKLVGRIYQLLIEQPVLNLEVQEEAAGDSEMRLTLSMDSRFLSEQAMQLFSAYRVVPSLYVPCLVRCVLRSEQILREARPTRAIRGAVRST